MASSSNKKKFSGLRILWIPGGGRKSHPKGRYSSTSKPVMYSSKQKKNEAWTLGGSKAQNELLDFPSEVNVASSSSLSILGPMSCALSQTSPISTISSNNSAPDTEITLPTTPITANAENTTSPDFKSPPAPNLVLLSKDMSPPIVITTAEILDLPTVPNTDLDLPKVPSRSEMDLSSSAMVLNSSSGTTASIATSSSPSTLRKADTQAGSLHTSPSKARYRNHNNNQEDINSIESISGFHNNPITTDFDWIDKMVLQRNSKEIIPKNDHKLLNKSTGRFKESDQLDGKNFNFNDTKMKGEDEESDDKIVKCLYYSLMCCDCTIS